MVINIRKGSHHSEESRKKIRKNHWSKSDNAEVVIEKLVIANIGHIPWNKGKEMTLEYCENISKHHNKNTILWSKGKTGVYSEETLKKMSDSHKGKSTWNKGKKMNDEWRINASNAHKGHLHSKETKILMSNSRKGSGNANWRGGKSFEPYCYKFNEEFKEYIRNKFERKCYICGISEEDQLPNAKKKHRLYIHHVDYNKNDICNGYSWAFIPLCSPCHSKTNGNRWYWFNKYMNYWIYDYIDFTITFSLI